VLKEHPTGSLPSNRSRVERDKRIEGIEPRRYFLDTSVDPTGARNHIWTPDKTSHQAKAEVAANR
jgi:hypothetical protein